MKKLRKTVREREIYLKFCCALLALQGAMSFSASTERCFRLFNISTANNQFVRSDKFFSCSKLDTIYTSILMSKPKSITVNDEFYQITDIKIQIKIKNNEIYTTKSKTIVFINYQNSLWIKYSLFS